MIYREEFFPSPACPINQLMLDVHVGEEPIYKDLTVGYIYIYIYIYIFFFFGVVEFTLNV